LPSAQVRTSDDLTGRLPQRGAWRPEGAVGHTRARRLSGAARYHQAAWPADPEDSGAPAARAAALDDEPVSASRRAANRSIQRKQGLAGFFHASPEAGPKLIEPGVQKRQKAAQQLLIFLCKACRELGRIVLVTEVPDAQKHPSGSGGTKRIRSRDRWPLWRTHFLSKFGKLSDRGRRPPIEQCFEFGSGHACDPQCGNPLPLRESGLLRGPSPGDGTVTQLTVLVPASLPTRHLPE
jgi:hypothetical protein